MARENEVDIGSMVDRAPLCGLHYLVVLLAFLAVVIDGYDIFVAGFIAPNLAREWHTPPQQIGSMFSIGLLGVVIGAPLLGMLGDRVGRRRAIVFGSIFYGLVTLASLWTTEIVGFTATRFLVGLGVGGVIPSALALVAEFIPARHRSVAMLLLMVGAPVGQLLPGLTAGLLVPVFGWHALLWVGGLAPIGIGLICWAVLPESMKYLALHPARQGELAALVTRLGPQPAPAAGAVFVSHEPALLASFSPAPLLRGGLMAATLLVWFCLAMGILSVYFISSWLPSMLQATGMTGAEAGLRMSVLSVGGTFGAAIGAWLFHRLGVRSILLTGIVGGAMMFLLGTDGLSAGQLVALMFAAGFCVISSINAVECVMGQIYPAAIRALGAGWGLGVARAISMIGPFVGGLLIAAHLPSQVLFAVPAGALVLCGLGAIGLRMVIGPRVTGWTPQAARG